MNVNRTPFNLIPEKWAFDPEIGPFIRDLLDILFQLRSRTGGDADGVDSLSFYTAPYSGAVQMTVNSALSATVSVDKFGAVGDGLADDTEAFQSAITYAETNGGTIFVPPGTYLTSSELVFNKPGIRMVGVGTGTTWDGLENPGTRIIASHTTGAVIRIRWENCAIENILIDSSAARQAASRDSTAANCNAGIRVEADDVVAPEGDVFSTTLRNVYVRQQPGDGILLIGRVYGSRIDSCYALDCGGHGFVVDSGTITGRTNTAVPGLVTIIGGNATRCQGHGMLLGNSTDAGNGVLPSFRCVVINWESNSNEVDATLREDDYSAWAFGDQNLFLNCAFSGKDSSDVVQQNSGLCLGGRDSKASACRYLDCNVAARVRFITGAVTTGITFDRMGIRASLANYAVTADTGATYTRVDIVDTTSVTVALETTQQTGEDVRYLTEHTVHGALNQSSFKSGRELSIADNAVVTIEFEAATYGILVINGNTVNAGPGIVAFKVGTSPYASLLTTSSTLEVSTGALTGTTGVDTKLTVSAHTDNRIYIENRTSSARIYTLTLLSIDNVGGLLPAE